MFADKNVVDKMENRTDIKVANKVAKKVAKKVANTADNKTRRRAVATC